MLRGILEEAAAGAVAVRVDNKRIEVPFAHVAEANLVFELAAQPKKGRDKGARAGRRGGGRGEGAAGGSP